MELYLGKKFKLEVWETCIKSMRVDEVASFTIEPHVRRLKRKIESTTTKKIMAFSHCMGSRSLPVQRMGLAQQEAMALVSFPVLDQCERFCILLGPIIPGPVSCMSQFRSRGV